MCKSPTASFFVIKEEMPIKKTSFGFSGGLGWAGNIMRFGKKRKKRERKKESIFHGYRDLLIF